MSDKAEFFWKNSNGVNIRTLQWQIEAPKAIIALVHGQGEHAGRYEHVADFFNKNGYSMLAMDNQGHGKSEGKRGHAPSLDSYLDDVGSFLDEVRTRYPNQKVFLYGHSMGGLLVLNYTLRRNPNIQGLIATSPWVRLAFEPNFIKVFVGKMLKSIVPGLVMPSGLDANNISRDKDCVQKYKNDPLVHGYVSAAGGLALMDGGDWLDAYSGAITVPLYMVHGTEDKLTSQPASAELAQRLTGNVTYKSYKGLYHETHNEPEKEMVLKDTLAWIENQI